MWPTLTRKMLSSTFRQMGKPKMVEELLGDFEKELVDEKTRLAKFHGEDVAVIAPESRRFLKNIIALSEQKIKWLEREIRRIKRAGPEYV